MPLVSVECPGPHQKLLTIVARKVAEGGLSAAPEKLQRRTAMVPGRLTRIIPSNPAGRPPGHTPATESPTAAPGNANANSPAPPAEGMAVKASVAMPVI